MKHLDLFSGIGGFSYAADQVWENVEHTFCDIDKFCNKVIRKHWPEAKIYEDIRTITTEEYFDLLTGGFPCQPFSVSGRKLGTEDDRYLWPEMLRVIRLTSPQWIIGENVGGLVTWNNGLVFERVCLDLEDAGYAVQPFVIPACAVQAPHRRDRIWFVANRNGQDVEGGFLKQKSNWFTPGAIPIPEMWKARESILSGPVLCRTADGIPDRVDRTKALGNAIVPQVAIEIMRAIDVTCYTKDYE